MSRTWVKLGATADGRARPASRSPSPSRAGGSGDRVIVTTTEQPRPTQTGESPPPARRAGYTEERTIEAIDGDTPDAGSPARVRPPGHGRYRGEVANLSRNVVVESADPAAGRGHTMYHRNSAGSIALRRVPPPGQGGRAREVQPPLPPDRRHDARQLGHRGVDLGQRQPLDHASTGPTTWWSATASATGASATASTSRTAPRPITCSTATWRSRRSRGKPLPEQDLPFDHNDGAGFWWANSRNTFTRNVAVECDRYGFRFEASAPTRGST